jgi:4-hydroxy-4-methyl-2-oxoglutarate aldolase
LIDDAPKVSARTPIRRPRPEQVSALHDVPTGFVVDALGGGGALDYRIKPVVPEQAAFCAVAVTCNAGPADNLAVFATLEHLQPGDAIVAATGGHTGCAVAGDLLLGMARNCGAVAFVTDGCVRDIPGIRAVGLPCFSMGVTPNSPAREGPGTVGFPVVVAGVAVCSGDLVIGDQDGVVVVPFDRIDAVIERMDAVRAAEAALDAKVKAGLRSPPFLKR